MTVSALHESAVALFRKQPDLTMEVLTGLLGIPIPATAKARMAESTLNQEVAVEFSADAAVLLEVDGEARMGAIVEVQLDWRKRKEYTWPYYATGARANHECP